MRIRLFLPSNKYLSPELGWFSDKRPGNRRQTVFFDDCGRVGARIQGDSCVAIPLIGAPGEGGRPVPHASQTFWPRCPETPRATVATLTQVRSIAPASGWEPSVVAAVSLNYPAGNTLSGDNLIRPIARLRASRQPSSGMPNSHRSPPPERRSGSQLARVGASAVGRPTRARASDEMRSVCATGARSEPVRNALGESVRRTLEHRTTAGGTWQFVVNMTQR